MCEWRPLTNNGFNAFELLLQYFSKIWKSIWEDFPPVIALANLAIPHECGVWLGLEPED